MLIDATERQVAERTAQHLAAVVMWSDDAIVSKDLSGIVTSWNPGAERLFGYSADEAIGCYIGMIIPPDRQDEENRILERIRRGEHIAHYETLRRRKDGTLVEISLTVSPIRAADGVIIGASKIARDITERRRAEREQQLLLKEIKHRVKNTAAAIQAIALQTFRSASSEERNAFCGRLHALCGAHELLNHQAWTRALLRDLAMRALEPFRDGSGQRIALHGPDVWLDASQASTMAMALHELATNATKYGALSNGTGHVSLRWKVQRREQRNWLKLRWRETGGPAVESPGHKGFGSHLIERALAAGDGRARARFSPRGLIFVAEIPVQPGTAAPN